LASLVGLVILGLAALWLYGLRADAGHSSGEIVIDRPPAQVFRSLTDDNRLKQWIGGLSDIREISAPPNGGEVGRKSRMTESYAGQSVQMEMVVTKFEQDRAISISVSSVDDPSNGFTETADYTLIDLGGKTRLRLDGKAKYSGFVPRLFEPIITPKATQKLGEDLARLKSLVESEPAASSTSSTAGVPSRLRRFRVDSAILELNDKEMREAVATHDSWILTSFNPQNLATAQRLGALARHLHS
jgi:uncharacterized protein YndB with AHSA1/START domain